MDRLYAEYEIPHNYLFEISCLQAVFKIITFWPMSTPQMTFDLYKTDRDHMYIMSHLHALSMRSLTVISQLSFLRYQVDKVFSLTTDLWPPLKPTEITYSMCSIHMLSMTLVKAAHIHRQTHRASPSHRFLRQGIRTIDNRTCKFEDNMRLKFH